MSELRQFRLPDVGEGLTEADIVKWHVKPGDLVRVNQIIVEIETAKAVVELPSPHAGTVSSLLVPEGATADVGTPIIAIEVGPASPAAGRPAHGDPAASAAAPGDLIAGTGATGAAVSASPGDGARPGEREASVPPDPASTGLVDPGALQTSTATDLVPPPPPEVPEAAAGTGQADPAQHQQRQAVLVGYGVKLGTTVRRARKPGVGRGYAAPAPAAPAASAAPATSQEVTAPSAAGSPPPSGSAPLGGAVLAKPPVRKLARDLGVDLSAVAGTGPSGSITRADVEAADVEAAGQAAGSPTAGSATAGSVTAGRVAALPREERVAVRGVRKHTAAAMTQSAFTAPHVTMFLEIDITGTMSATERLRALPDFDGVRVSPLLLVAKALLVAAARHPMINSSWDETAQEIVVRHYVNLGIAAATDRGLVVPNVKDAHALSLPDLGRALNELADSARGGKPSPASLAGGTISITNVGVFGVDTGTPILPPGEAAILVLGQVKDAPWVHEGQLAVRKVCTLGMSFDHRIVDGDLGAAVLRDVGLMLTDPLRMLAWS